MIHLPSKNSIKCKKHHGFHNKKYIVGFKEKNEIFSTFFVEECSIISINSLLPSQLTLLTKNCLGKYYFPKKWLSLFKRMEINKLLKIIIQFHFYLFMGKYCNAYSMALCLIFSQRIISFLQINLEIFGLINFPQLIMKY